MKIGMAHCRQHLISAWHIRAEIALNTEEEPVSTHPLEDSPNSGVTTIYGQKHEVWAEAEHLEETVLRSDHSETGKILKQNVILWFLVTSGCKKHISDLSCG